MFTWPEKPFVTEEKENKYPGKLVLELPEPGAIPVFLFLRFALISEAANGVKYRAMIMCFFSRGKYLGKRNTIIHSVPKLLQDSGVLEKKA